MKNHFEKSIAFRTMLSISLFFIVVFITGSGVSCQSQEPAPAPPVPSPGLPTSPTPGEPPAMPPQIEVAIGDEVTALVFRNLVELDDSDITKLRDYARDTGVHIYLQPAGPESAYALWPEYSRLHYQLSQYDVTIEFLPTDFTQVNADINQTMIPHALSLLDPQADETVLDLFCGLGNFSLPLARSAKKRGSVASASPSTKWSTPSNSSYLVVKSGPPATTLALSLLHQAMISLAESI